MKPSSLLVAVLHAIKTRTPLLITSAPGMGKSAIVRDAYALIKKNDPDFRFVDLRLSLYQPVDIKGLPTVDGDTARWTKPDFFRQIAPGTRGILFIDEITAARPEVQAAIYELVYDRRIGEYELPEGWAIVAAGNRVGDKAVAYATSTALSSRFIQVELDADFDDWFDWALGNGIEAGVLGFLKLRPTLLHQFDPQAKVRAFPCPRTWEMVSRNLPGLAPEIEFDMIAGTIGEGAATELVGVLRLMDSMPDPDEIIANPATAAIPDKPAVLYALAVCLARRVKLAEATAFFTYADRLPGDFSVLMVREAIKREAAIQTTKGFIGWAATHKDVLI